jgi:hypothetical protein
MIDVVWFFVFFWRFLRRAALVQGVARGGWEHAIYREIGVIGTNSSLPNTFVLQACFNNR